MVRVREGNQVVAAATVTFGARTATEASVAAESTAAAAQDAVQVGQNHASAGVWQWQGGLEGHVSATPVRPHQAMLLVTERNPSVVRSGGAAGPAGCARCGKSTLRCGGAHVAAAAQACGGGGADGAAAAAGA